MPVLLLLVTLLLPNSSAAIEWRCHAWLLRQIIRPISVVEPSPEAEDPRWISLGSLLDEQTAREISVQRPNPARTPVRQTIREWVGWKPKTVKFYIAIKESTRLIENLPYLPERARLFRNSVKRLGNFLGIQPSLYHYHWSLYVVDEQGEVRGVESPGPFEQGQPRLGLSNRDSILMPVTFLSEEAEKEALRKFDLLRKGQGGGRGCGHSVCQVLQVDPGQSSISLCRNFRLLVNGNFVHIDRVIVLGTRIESASDLERSAFYTDWGYLSPKIARPLILVSEMAALIWVAHHYWKLF